jgi:hypothetical protein
VGVTGEPVDPGWSAFDQRYQWFGKPPRSVTSGAHLFVLAVDRWRSAVVGLYETVSAGAAKLSGSPNPERLPWALGVRPMAAIPPPAAVRVDGQTGPESGLPERVYDKSMWPSLYAAVASSPPPPGPTTLEQRIQELEPEDVVEDVLAAVSALGPRARGPEVIDLAIEMGDWSADELAARAWYTDSGTPFHVRHIVAAALQRAHVLTRTLDRPRGSGPYVLRGAPSSPGPLGVAYRPAAPTQPTEPDDAPHKVDLAALETATARHMALQDEQQVRLGVGQILEYCHRMRDATRPARPVLLLEGEPPDPWVALLDDDLGIAVIRSDRLSASIDALLSEPKDTPLP